jgi:hypothetical protein
VLAEKEAEEEELAEDNWARHQRWGEDPRGKGRRRRTARHNTRTGAQSPARAGQGRQEDPEAAIRATRANAARVEETYTTYTVVYRTPHTAHRTLPYYTPYTYIVCIATRETRETR